MATITARRLTKASAKIRHWTDERDRLVVEMRSERETLEAIAVAAGLSHPGVIKILRRQAQP